MNPLKLCGFPVRGGGVCSLDEGHRGLHTSHTYVCDSCGKRRRGAPAFTDNEEGLGVCFLCVAEAKRAYIKRHWPDKGEVMIMNQPGPCAICGCVNYPPSSGGPNVCPACDAGVEAPTVRYLARELDRLRTRLEHSEAEATKLRREIVPREPTEAMMQAAYEDKDNRAAKDNLLLNPEFVYVPADETDIRRTFVRCCPTYRPQGNPMARPRLSVAKVRKELKLPLDIATAVDLLLFSDAEGRVPYGAWEHLVVHLLREHLARIKKEPKQ